MNATETIINLPAQEVLKTFINGKFAQIHRPLDEYDIFQDCGIGVSYEDIQELGEVLVT